MDNNSLSHTKWNCKYHIVFAPKYRRKVAYGKIKQDIADILSMLCKRKGVKIVEAEIEKFESRKFISSSENSQNRYNYIKTMKVVGQRCVAFFRALFYRNLLVEE